MIMKMMNPKKVTVKMKTKVIRILVYLSGVTKLKASLKVSVAQLTVLNAVKAGTKAILML